MIVYITINKISGSYYIGITNGNNDYKNYLGSGTVLKDAVKSYGKENFRRFTLEKCTDRLHASDQEKFWLSKASLKWPNKKCYNLTEGGENSFIRTPEANKKISGALKKHYQDNKQKLLPIYRKRAYHTMIAHNKKHGVWNKGTSTQPVHIKNGNRGSGNRAAKLSEKDVLDIRKLWKTGTYLQREIAKRYDVNQNLISRIVNNKIWTHL